MALNPVEFVDNYIFPRMFRKRKLTAKQKKEIRDSWLELASCIFDYLKDKGEVSLFIRADPNYTVSEIIEGTDPPEIVEIEYYNHKLHIE